MIEIIPIESFIEKITDIHFLGLSDQPKVSEIINLLPIYIKDKDLINEINQLYKAFIMTKNKDIFELLIKKLKSVDISELYDQKEITDKELDDIMSDVVGRFMYDDRKDDEELSRTRIQNYFDKNPNAIELVSAKFKKALTEYLTDD